MIPSFSKNPDLNNALFIMSSLSPVVKEGIELELYRESADSDGSTDQFILEFAFIEFLKDLDTIGITLKTEYSELVGDLTKLHQFLRLMMYIFPSSLYQILKTDTIIRACVHRIIDGSLGDHETFLQTYLSELGGLDGHTALVPELTDVVDLYYMTLNQSDLFTDAIRNIVMLVDNEKLSLESDSESHQAYRDVIRNFVVRMSDIVNSFSQYSDYDQLCRIQDFIIRDWVAPVNFTEYNYLFLESQATLPEELVPGFIRKQYHYRVSHMWCLEYYKVRGLIPTQTQYIMIYCFLYAMNPTYEDFVKATEEHRTLPVPADALAHATALYQEHSNGR